ALEFTLGNKNPDMIRVFDYDPAIHDWLKAILERPGLYDEFLRYLARRGLPVPAEKVERDWSQPYERSDAVTAVFKTIYENRDQYWDAYEMAEKLVDLEENFQLWR